MNVIRATLQAAWTVGTRCWSSRIAKAFSSARPSVEISSVFIGVMVRDARPHLHSAGVGTVRWLAVRIRSTAEEGLPDGQVGNGMPAATSTAARSGLALVIAVLVALGGSTASQRLVAGKAEVALGERRRPTIAQHAEPPVIPDPVGTPLATPGTAVPVAELVGTPEPAATPFTPVTDPTRAAVVVDVDPTTEARAREVLAGLDGILHVTAVDVATVPVGGVAAEVALVDPTTFRPFTPEETANHQPLWDRVAAGDLAVTHEFGTTREVPLGSMLAVGPAGVPVRVGAFATNGTPPIADAILARSQAEVLGPTTTRLLVGVARDASPTATAEALADAGLDAEEVPDPRLPQTDVVVPPAGITPENVWDHLALCESSGDWHINTGNGYYGGIQFLPESWWAVGGTGLPHEHTREEQIYRGTLLWQIQGWEAWPQCARRLGLIVDPPPQPAADPDPEPS